MTVFSLAVYSCLTVNFPLSGDLMQKTCIWQTQGGLYATKDACLRASPPLGSPIFSDVADGRRVDAVRCNEQPVTQ